MSTNGIRTGSGPALRWLAAALLLAAGGVFAADHGHDGSGNAATDGMTGAVDDRATVQELQREWDQAIEALKTYSATQREEALARAERLLESMDVRIDRLEATAADEWSQLSEGLSERRKETMQSLREQRRELAAWYGGMRHSSALAWEEVREGFVEAYGSLSESFTDALAAFRDSRAAQAETSGN